MIYYEFPKLKQKQSKQVLNDTIHMSQWCADRPPPFLEFKNGVPSRDLQREVIGARRLLPGEGSPAAAEGRGSIGEPTRSWDSSARPEATRVGPAT
jgi:hypothetical protein